VNAASLTLTPGNADDKQANVVFNGGGTINISGNMSAGTAANAIRTQINFGTSGGILTVGGNWSGGQISGTSGTINIAGNVTTPPINNGFTGMVNFNGGGIQTITGAATLTNLAMTNAASILTLGGNLTVTGTLTLTAGKINTQTFALILTGTPATQISGGSSASYVYSTGAGRLQRNGLTAAASYTFPVGTSTNYMPVVLVPSATNDFAVNVYTPASVTGVQGGAAFTDKSSMVDAVWNIDRPTGTGSAGVIIQWVDALEGSNFATFGDGQIGISQFSAGSWSPAIATTAIASANIVGASFSTFGAFGVGLIGVVLPVKFGSIKAYEKQNGIQLDWKVYSENKVKSYEVERSADGRSYTSVGSLPALYNNTSDGDYGFFDANPLPGTSYYRIKNNDLDGKSAYSIVVRVNRNKTIKGLSLYPNPIVNGIVLLQGSDLGRGNYKINIFGANGQEIYKQQIKHNGGTISHTIELPSTISKGVYMLSVKDENGNIIFKDKLVNQ
jgi:Secretion system C-terminal sorting domain